MKSLTRLPHDLYLNLWNNFLADTTRRNIWKERFYYSGAHFNDDASNGPDISSSTMSFSHRTHEHFGSHKRYKLVESRDELISWLNQRHYNTAAVRVKRSLYIQLDACYQLELEFVVEMLVAQRTHKRDGICYKSFTSMRSILYWFEIRIDR